MNIIIPPKRIPIYSRQNDQYRKTQSANKKRLEDSPIPIYSNFTHKNAKQPRMMIFQNHTQQTQSFLQQSIDVNDYHCNKKSVSSHNRIKTETDKLPNFNKRFYPNEMHHFLHLIEEQKKSLNPQIQIRDQSSRSRTKQISQPDLNLQDQFRRLREKQQNRFQSTFKNIAQEINYSDAIPRKNQQDSGVKEVSQFELSVKKATRSEDPSPLDPYFNRMKQICNQEISKEEDIMQFSFGLQYHKKQLRDLNKRYQDKRFPKEVFLGDVRKVKRIYNHNNTSQLN